MGTNNRQFSRLKISFGLEMITFFVLLICIDLSYKKYTYFLLVILLILMVYVFVSQYMTLKDIFTKMREIVCYIDQNKEGIFLEGDIGLLYDKMLSLKKRADAYSQLILKEKNKLKETIENICHQMKTPLSSISINNELLMEDMMNKRLLINQQQIEKMKYFLNSLLTLAKLENHTVEFEFQKLPLHYLIDLSLQDIDSFHSDCIIDNNIQDIDFYYDENWLVEAIINILKNGLEQKSVHHMTITNEVIGEYLKLYIQDDGDGINQKDLPHIFERFYKCQNQKKDSIGIGLALSQEIVKEHHGYIDVYNKEGACFELTFPLLQVSQKIDL